MFAFVFVLVFVIVFVFLSIKGEAERSFHDFEFDIFVWGSHHAWQCWK